ncbi:hypothetical protein MnBA_37960 [Marinobacterium sp. BA1]
MRALKSIPQPIDHGRYFESTLDILNYQLRKYKTQQEQIDTSTSSERFACGWPVPQFQRPLVWSRAQQVAFIESAWLGLPLGTYTLHEEDWDDSGKALPFSGCVIDGQQRLTALEQYWDDQFTVFDLYWSELDHRDMCRFMNIKFAHYRAALWSESEIHDLYNRMALGGTPHTAEQRAGIHDTQ